MWFYDIAKIAMNSLVFFPRQRNSGMFEENRYTPSEQILSEVESLMVTERVKGMDSSRVVP